MPDRFVILHHRLDGGEHWDLMLEHGDVLLTWQLLREPIDRASLPIPARRIGDHRKAYLDYEGPLTRNRGTVHRVDFGSMNMVEITPECCRLVLSGQRLRGSFTLQKDGDEWLLVGSGARSPASPKQ